jgi:hypothetical protein
MTNVKMVRLPSQFKKRDAKATQEKLRSVESYLRRYRARRLVSNPISVGMDPARSLPSGNNIVHGQKMTNIDGEASKSVSESDVKATQKEVQSV